MENLAHFCVEINTLSHSIVELFARGTPGSRAPFSPDELLESGTGIYLRGLGILKDQK